MNDTSTISSQSEKSGSTGDLKAGKDAVTEAYDKLMEAKAHFRKAAEAAGLDLKDEAMDKVHQGREDLEALGSQVVASTQKNPLAAIGIAFLVGFVFSKLMSRN
ncbi:Uncharacterised protein [Halioglobus japonicus]|nr:Uncharacterised protein [Halioglobus japonicus]